MSFVLLCFFEYWCGAAQNKITRAAHAIEIRFVAASSHPSIALDSASVPLLRALGQLKVLSRTFRCTGRRCGFDVTVIYFNEGAVARCAEARNSVIVYTAVSLKQNMLGAGSLDTPTVHVRACESPYGRPTQRRAVQGAHRQ